MLMMPVPIFDSLEIELTESGIELTCNDPNIPSDSNNLVYRAAELFKSKACISAGIRIHLEKTIPAEAGLGGGSGNAAGILLALNKLHKNPLSQEDLQEIASYLGSDVTFFLQKRPAIAKGRGENIKPIGEFSALDGKSLLLIRPRFGIPTPWAYNNLAQFPSARNRPLGQAEELASELTNGNLIKSYKKFYNSLELPVFNKFPLIKLMKEYALNHGAESALMCGSGSTVFIICSNKNDSESLGESFKSNFGPLAMAKTVTLPGDFNYD